MEYGLSKENQKHNLDFVVKLMGLKLVDFVKYPILFAFKLEKRIIF